MTPSEAAKFLEVATDATPEQLEARFLELRRKLEDKMVIFASWVWVPSGERWRAAPGCVGTQRSSAKVCQQNVIARNHRSLAPQQIIRNFLDRHGPR